LKYTFTGAPAYIAFEATKRYLQASTEYHARLYTIHVDHGTIKLCLELYVCLYFCYGIYWSPLATSFSYWLMFLLLLAYAKFIKGSEG
jgi:MATE family multidrug resistance protein